MSITRRRFLAGALLGTGAFLPRGGAAPPAVDGGRGTPPAVPGPDDSPDWTFFVINDTCPDYTWGNDEESTRRNFAELVRAHLDLMIKTDGDEAPDRDRFNMATTNEALCFLEKYPERQDELAGRIKEGRVFLSPFLCNSLWGSQGVEGFLRTFYPARRLERRWGVTLEVAEHIELPSIPCGAATLLAGCGVRWLSVPFLDYDSTFGGLASPPLLVLEGPDGSRVRVVMDAWACRRGHYVQGRELFKEPNSITEQWLPHYRGLGAAYPLRAILVSGTHGDTSPKSAGEAVGFAKKIKGYNQRPGPPPRLVNAALPDYCKAVDEAEGRIPFLPTLRGCFGHSWELWAVTLARYAAGLREGERSFLTAEALVAVAGRTDPGVSEATRADRERAEWCLAMGSDHAWNATDDANRRENARLCRAWVGELNDLSRRLIERGWSALGLTPGGRDVTVFNGLGAPRSDLIRLETSAGSVSDGATPLDVQAVEEDGNRALYFVAPAVAGFSLKAFKSESGDVAPRPGGEVRGQAWEIESPSYKVRVDARNGGIASLIHRASGAELVAGGDGRTLCETVSFDGQEHRLEGVKSAVVADGPVLSRLRIEGTVAGSRVVNFVTIYRRLDRVDFDVRVTKPVSSGRERLCQVFPILQRGSILRAETTGAVIRPAPQPLDDLLPGADTRRLAVQGFVEATFPDGLIVTIAPLDAFALRLDLGQVTFEALGNDANEMEVTRDQDGVTEFRFRYALRARSGDDQGSGSLEWSRAVGSPMLAVAGRASSGQSGSKGVVVDPQRAIATCFKPGDDERAGGVVLRLSEVAGRAGPLKVGVPGYRGAVRTDLLESDIEDLPVVAGEVELALNAHGFAGLRLLS